MYHHVSPDKSDGLTISPTRLEEQFSYLVKKGYKSYHLSELMDLTRLPSKKSVVITFDDAYVSQMTWAYPLLVKYNLKAVFFAPLFYLGKKDAWSTDSLDIMTANQLKTLDPQVIELGFHSFHHNKYHEMSEEEITTDTNLCFKSVSENELPLRAALAYPYGKYPKKLALKSTFFRFLEAQGFQYGFRIGNRVNNFPFKDPFEIQRLDVKGQYSLSKFKRKLKFGKLV